ncbi:MAG TPA: helix-turn-helix domain-containing protein [Polyangiaceae bacterium]|nr:helix-turn-helix domain-containing protein [Polyangiaceae bacterium]
MQDFIEREPLTERFRPVPLRGGEPRSELGPILSLLGALDALSELRDLDAMLRQAVELGRERLGLERVRIYMRERNPGDRIVMRGTWGTGVHGQTTDEHHLYHEFPRDEHDALLASRLSGQLGMHHAQAPWFATEPGPSTVVIGSGWVVATPIVAGRELLGVMYNDCALGGGPVDEQRQAAVAVYCSLLAVLCLSKRSGASWQPLPQKAGQSPLVERVLQAVREDLPMTGEQLAQELGVSPGHLARSFKREMGVSLVDYRNRRRIDRFFESISRAGGTVNLLDAALEAGFGSYAQFHRVYRKFLGTAPREVLSGGMLAHLRAARGAPPRSGRRLHVATDSYDPANEVLASGQR